MGQGTRYRRLTSVSGAAPYLRIRVIYNPTSGEKAGLSINGASEEEIRALMERHGLGHDLVVTETEEAGVRAAREAVAAQYDLVVAAGGDGTVGVIACELLDTQTALGVLPLGSIMNIPRMLDLPRDVEGAAATLKQCIVRTIDVGEASGQLFFEAGSVGLNAAIFREGQRFGDGEYASILRGIWVMLRYRPARMMLHLDDRVVKTRALMVTVANGPYTGIGFTIAPGARLDDGLFDVRVFRGFSKMELLLHLWKIAFGRRRYSPKVSTYRSSRVHVESVHPLPCRADSHDLGTTPVTFTVRSGALRIAAPPPPHPDSDSTET